MSVAAASRLGVIGELWLKLSRSRTYTGGSHSSRPVREYGQNRVGATNFRAVRFLTPFNREQAVKVSQFFLIREGIVATHLKRILAALRMGAFSGGALARTEHSAID